MKVYHASTVVVESPDTTYSRVLLPICKSELRLCS